MLIVKYFKIINPNWKLNTCYEKNHPLVFLKTSRKLPQFHFKICSLYASFEKFNPYCKFHFKNGVDDAPFDKINQKSNSPPVNTITYEK